MLNKLLLSFNLEHFPANDFQSSISKEESAAIAVQGLNALIEMLERRQAKATFFVANDFLVHCQKHLKMLLANGHEVACHGFDHSDNYLQMPKEVAVKKLSAAKNNIEEILSCKVLGFRAPRMQLLPKEILKEVGFSYDASLNPIFLPGHYNNFRKLRMAFKEKGIAVMPVSATPFFRFPFSSVFFKSLGLSYSKICSRFCLIDLDFLHLYFHPWDFAEVERKQFPKMPWYMLRNNGNKALDKLEKYIIWCAGKNIDTVTISKYLLDKGLI